MKLLLRRGQKKNVMDRMVFSLTVRAELTEEEMAHINTYRLGDTVLYERKTLVDRGSGLLGAASRLAFRMTNLSLNVRDLANGKVIECKDVVEMLAIEEQIKEAAQTFQNVLLAAASFGGEEVLALDGA